MEELLNPVQQETVEVVDIQFRPGQKIYFFDPNGTSFVPGDHVIMDTARGAEYGICAGGNHAISAKEVVAPLRKILRKATEQDEKINAENRSRERRAFEVCMQKIQHHGLDMQLVSAECAFDGSKILFYFTADERVDFRELVKDLAGVFHTRIELRQIGVRDKAKMVGGLGICGRPFCCASFLDDFQPVSIKMAKTQNLSLNPTKISGTCGRLMCCLKYEQEAYEDLLKTSPKNESFVDTVDGRGTVVDVNLLRQTVRVRMEDQPDQVNCYRNCDICVLRNGKAKKNDPPIPKEIAPISSKPRPVKKEEEVPDEPLPEVIITGRDVPPVMPEPAWEPEEVAAPPQEEKPEGAKPANRRRRRRKPAAPAQETAARPENEEKSQKPKAEKPRQEKPRLQGQPKQPKAENKAEAKAVPAPKAEAAPKADGSKSGNYHRRRRRPRSGPKPEGKE